MAADGALTGTFHALDLLIQTRQIVYSTIPRSV
jgi:hypothetical protein